jgi:hypothetical protein
MNTSLDATRSPDQDLRSLSLGELDAIAGAKDNSWVVSFFGRVFFGKVDDGQGPSFGFACVKPGKTTYCVAF